MTDPSIADYFFVPALGPRQIKRMEKYIDDMAAASEGSFEPSASRMVRGAWVRRVCVCLVCVLCGGQNPLF